MLSGREAPLYCRDRRERSASSLNLFRLPCSKVLFCTAPGAPLPVTPALYRNLRRFGLALACLLLVPSAWAEGALLERYRMIRDGSADTLPGTTITLSSSVHAELPSAEVSSILSYPFDTVAAALARAENWCRFMPLHFNIKACTFETKEGEELLTLYSGRKSYQSPEESYEMVYRLETLRRDERQLSLRLHAGHGPANTRDYLIELDALQVEEGTLLHIHSSYRPSLLSAVLARGYLATLGRDKVGFSRIGQTGDPQFVQGERGVIERNVMRYHLAVDAFLSTRTLPESSRHEATLKHWFRQNDGYPQQLHEMDEAEYLAIKRGEWKNQQKLQQALNATIRLATTP